jgi:energy-coupling factor transporter ATP-binding protein EcfA2
MLKFSGVKITLTSYIEVLQKIFSRHALGNIGNIMKEVSWEKRFYALISIGFYLFSIYQNSLVCYRFYQNFKQIHDDLFLLIDYLNITLRNMDEYSKLIYKHNTYTPFLNCLQEYKHKLESLLVNLNKINKFTFSHKKLNEIGYVMKYYYEIHINEDIKDIIEYSFGFNAYMEHLQGIEHLYREKLIKKCKFGRKLKFKNIYNAYLLDKTPTKNNISFDKNIIVTGPNASGKTTILKSILFNLIFSQSYGFGFYDSATIPLYNKIHCYLNIPDTSGRDSLFQAEARRCKEIIDSFKNNEKHFCIFDELFSGTNPNEACSSSYGFIKYMLNKKVDFILTTHLHELCLQLNDNILNLNMEVLEQDNFSFKYSYQIKNGISSIKGGIKVLKDLNYPNEIIQDSILFRSNY